ncbi:uncharacterized protein LOC122046353 [Zingiber officinale]|uniref:uncharacterized protein LOC122046353 n=1 Tax=Zingiber officinale TaxID=94328 RepID=UPI001C4DCF8A|nr:uncharacterized protein LOC122046353 [Zingiber officinale]
MSPPKPMPSSSPINCVVVTFLHFFFVASCVALPRDADLKTLNVGIELKAETLPLRSGRRTYELLGLRRSSSYEVKISYPASIPAKFSIQLQRPRLELRSTKNRRLLDTEKLIFKADQEESVFVSLTVENGGVIAMKSVPEQELVIYNIVCDELMLGIPHDAWRVGIAALLCLLLGVVLSKFLPLLINKGLETEDAAAVAKDS